ncbi:MAG: type pilus assembly PilZ [Acidobacteriales bacterium]|nr:type pilus assembly PilZ [Terriglobales bacterium]
MSTLKSNVAPKTAITIPVPANGTTRRWERFKIEVRFKAVLTKLGKATVLYGQGTDVSEGGMAAYIPTELSIGDSVELELALPYLTGQQPLRINACVRNRNGFRYGLEYMNLKFSDREMLLKCLRALSLTQ